MNITPTVKQLLIINILFFIGSQIVGEQSYTLFSLYYFENSKFQLWQPITHMFMHGGVSHILFNMFALYSFGSTLEHYWGSKKFLFFYFSCGIGAFLLHTGVSYYFFHHGLNILTENGFAKTEIIDILNQSKIDTRWVEYLGQSGLESFTNSFVIPTVGASGAIYGLLVAFTFMFPNAELSLMFIPIPVKAKYFVPVFMLLYDGFFGILGNSFLGMQSGVAHFAHLGGALVGFLMMWYWKKNQFSKNRWN
jgi:membrane associated rhomboid family serine protease